MSRKWIALLVIVAFVGVAVYFAYVRESRIVEVPVDGVRMWFWDGEMARGSTGNWVPGK
jgi:hypothetical protein